MVVMLFFYMNYCLFENLLISEGDEGLEGVVEVFNVKICGFLDK